MQVQRLFCFVLGLSLAIALPKIAIAKPHAEMSSEMDSKTDSVQIIHQPFAVKAAVTAGGVALIGLELWWFLFSQPQKKD